MKTRRCRGPGGARASGLDGGDATPRNVALSTNVVQLDDRRRVVDLAKAGAPVAVIGPGPRWRPRHTGDGDVALPAA
jgi:hypothetical protein